MYRPWQKINHSRLVEILALGYTSVECAEEFGCSLNTLIEYVKRHELKTKWRKIIRFTPEQKKDIIKMANKGIPLKCIANIYHRNYDVIRVLVRKWGVKCIYHVKGNKAAGKYGVPVSNDEIILHWNSVYTYLRNRYKRVESDILHDAVNQSSLELRRIPRQIEWLALWRRIAVCRVVDEIRRQTGDSSDGRRKDGVRRVYKDLQELLTISDELALEDAELVENMLSKLEPELRKLVELKMHSPADAVKLSGLSESSFYRRLAEAYEVIRSTHSFDD